MASKWQFILVYTVFLGFIISMVSLSAGSITGFSVSSTEGNITNVTTTPPTPPNIVAVEIFGFPVLDMLGLAVWGIQSIGFFFSLMSVSTTFTILGWILFSPLILTILWIILELIRGSGS